IYLTQSLSELIPKETVLAALRHLRLKTKPVALEDASPILIDGFSKAPLLRTAVIDLQGTFWNYRANTISIDLPWAHLSSLKLRSLQDLSYERALMSQPKNLTHLKYEVGLHQRDRPGG